MGDVSATCDVVNVLRGGGLGALDTGLVLGIFGSVIAFISLAGLVYLLSGRRVTDVRTESQIDVLEASTPRTYLFYDPVKLNSLYAEAVSRRRSPDQVDVQIEGGRELGSNLSIAGVGGEARLSSNQARSEHFEGSDIDWTEKPEKIEAVLRGLGRVKDVTASSSADNVVDPQLHAYLEMLRSGARRLQFTLPSDVERLIVGAWRGANPPLDLDGIRSISAYVSVSADFELVERPASDGTGLLKLKAQWPSSDGSLSVEVICSGNTAVFLDLGMLRDHQSRLGATCFGKVVRGGREDILKVAAAYCYIL